MQSTVGGMDRERERRREDREKERIDMSARETNSELSTEQRRKRRTE